MICAVHRWSIQSPFNPFNIIIFVVAILFLLPLLPLLVYGEILRIVISSPRLHCCEWSHDHRWWWCWWCPSVYVCGPKNSINVVAVTSFIINLMKFFSFFLVHKIRGERNYFIEWERGEREVRERSDAHSAIRWKSGNHRLTQRTRLLPFHHLHHHSIEHRVCSGAILNWSNHYNWKQRGNLLPPTFLSFSHTLNLALRAPIISHKSVFLSSVCYFEVLKILFRISTFASVPRFLFSSCVCSFIRLFISLFFCLLFVLSK